MEGDAAGKLRYIKEYKRVYAGRGFPVSWDERIAYRARTSVASDGVSKEEVAKLVAASMREAVSKMESLTSENKKIRKELDSIKRAARQRRGSVCGLVLPLPKCDCLFKRFTTARHRLTPQTRHTGTLLVVDRPEV